MHGLKIKNKIGLSVKRGAGLPANVPAGWQRAWKFDAASYSSWDDVKRTGGNQFEGYADGYGLFQWGTDTGSTYDARGTVGQDEDFCPDPDYPGWSIQNITFEDGQMVVKIGLATAFGIEDLVPYRTTDTRHTLIGARFSTEESLKFKGDHAMRLVATWPDETGIWSNMWSFTKGRSPLVTPSLFEIDYAEVANADAGNKRVWATATHGDTVPGGTYESSNTWVDTGVTIGGVEREFLVVREGDDLKYYLDGVLQDEVTIDADWDAKDDFTYLRFDFDTCNTPTWPGVYDGTPTIVECKIRSIEIYMPPSEIATNLVYTLGEDDGYGPDRVSGQPVTDGVSPGAWASTGTDSDGTPVGGVTPIVHASGGSIYHRRYYTGSWQIDNDTLHANEPGATRTNCGFDYGTTYHFEFVFDYGTSNAGYVNVGVAGGGNLQFTIAGTSVTPSVGSALNAAITTDSDGRKVLSFDWVADATGDSHISLGPNSATIGHTIIWYTAEARPLIGSEATLEEQVVGIGPSALFDPSDLTSLYQSRTGGSAGAVNSVVGIMLDKSQMGGATAASYIAGRPNLVTNPDVAATWTSEAAAVTISQSGAAVRVTAASASNQFATFSATTVVGSWYCFQADVFAPAANSTVNAGRISIDDGLTVRDGLTAEDVWQTKVVWFRATSTTTKVYLEPAATSVWGAVSDYAEFKNIKFSAVSGNHAVAPSDAARPILRNSGSLYYLETDGVDDWMNVTPTANLGETWWHVGGWRLDTDGGYAFATSSEANGRAGYFRNAASGQWNNSVPAATDIHAGDVRTAHVVTIEQASTTSLSGRFNGAAGSTITPYDDSLSTQGLVLFSRRNTSFSAGGLSRFYCGVWGTGSLSTAQRAIVEQYMAAKTGVTL